MEEEAARLDQSLQWADGWDVRCQINRAHGQYYLILSFMSAEEKVKEHAGLLLVWIVY